MVIKKIIFIAILTEFLVVANFSFAAGSVSVSSQNSIESLQGAYYSALQSLVVLLQEQVAALSQQLKGASSSVAVSGLSTSSQPTSTPPTNNYSGSLFDYYPTWHLAPGSCIPQLY